MRIERYEKEDSKAIRLAGGIVGVVILIGAPYLYLRGEIFIHHLLASLFLSVLFVAHALGGSRAFFRLLPTSRFLYKLPFLDYDVKYKEKNK